MILADARLIFAKSDVQYPMQPVFNLPVFSHRLEKGLGGSCPTADEIADGDFGFGGGLANGQQFHQTGELCPSLPPAQVSAVFRLPHHPTLPNFAAIMPFGNL